jgi:hypothetical protein
MNRRLLYPLYALLPVGALIGFFVHRMAGTVIVVAAVIALVAVSLTAKDTTPGDGADR